MSASHRIVIVGGGAGGLELATRLGDTLGKRGKASITLVDLSRTHLWKPLLHQVAAGSLDLGNHELDYLAQARWHHFNFQLGRMEGLDRRAREVLLAATYDDEGREILPRRALNYDTLILAVGSTTNDFGTPGAAQHAISLDRPEQAAIFHRRLVNACLRANTQGEPLRPEQLHVAIIGAGATGVELAAELHNTTRELLAYGLDRIDAERDIRITIVEAAERILPALPPRLSLAAEGLLRKLGVEILTRDPVASVDATGVTTAGGRRVDAELVIWAAGIKAPDFLRDIAGLESNRSGQLVVDATLQTSRDPDIFALGDCAACPWPEHGSLIPPRAQAAHQQASHLVKAMRLRLAGRELKPFRYRDFGSLVSLGKYSTVGSLMGGLHTGSLTVEGRFALLMYKSLYKMHLLALHGPIQVFLDSLARLLTRRSDPRVKLH